MMLEVGNLHAYYGKSHILQGVDLCINAGEVVSLLGRNGVGRSTTVKAIMGEVAPQGTIKFRGTDIVGMPSFDAIRLECILWKVVQILRDNHIATSHNRRCQHMTIIRVGQLKTDNQPFITRNERIPDCRIHQRACALQCSAIPMRFWSATAASSRNGGRACCPCAAA